MNFRRSLVLTGVAFSAMALAACTSTTPGTPAPSTVPSTGSSSDAPKVTNPLPGISAYVAKPCDLVPQSLVTELGYSDPQPTAANGPFGPGCGWIDTQGANSKNFNVGIGIYNGKGDGGIANVYKANGSLFGFVEPTDVSGYPAAYADTADHRAQGKCTVYVGVTDDVTLQSAVDGYENEQDSCGTAKRIASAVITTLQGGS